MKKIGTFVVNHTKLIVALFFAAAVICTFLRQFVGVNYEMSDYLPSESPSTVALDTMEEEFDGGIPNARVMVKDVTIPEALEYKEKLENIDGVTDVTWLDDAASVTVPLETQDADTVETYYKDGAALYTVTISTGKELDAVSEIRELIGKENAVTGNAVSSADATVDTVEEVKKIAVIALIFILLILTATTSSWLEPVVILIGLGVAVLINSGTNLIFGEISFVTNAAGSILQLAVSLDYYVFLIHRFEECYREIGDPKDAMVDALCKSLSSILSSGLTTVIGFLALIFMRFGIGPDLGLALAKGIAISLISVFIFMPALILVFHKLLRKTRHRAFLPGFGKFGRLISRVMFPAVCIFAMLVVPAYRASNHNNFYYGSGYIYDEGTKYGKDKAAIEAVFGENDTYVLMVPNGNLSTERTMSDELREIPRIKTILSYVDTVGQEIPKEYLDEDIVGQLQSEHYSRFVISVDTPPEGEDTFALIENIRDIAQKWYPDTYLLAGDGVSSLDLKDTVEADMVKVNLIAIGAVFLVLVVMMRKLLLPAILVLCIETAIWLNLAVPYFSGQTIFYISYLIISSIQLGSTVDYAILLTDRYHEYRQTLDRKEAIVETIATVTVSAAVSASTLTVAGLLLGAVSTHGVLSLLGTFIGRGAIFSVLIVFFVLPGFLYLSDRKQIEKCGKKHSRRQKVKEGGLSE